METKHGNASWGGILMEDKMTPYHVLSLFFSETVFNFGQIINKFQKGIFLGHPVY